MNYVLSSSRWLVLAGVLLLGTLVAWTWSSSDSSEGSEVVETTAPVPPTVTLQEWEVPWENTRPRDPDIAADGRVWFVGQVGNYIASFDPGTEEFEKYDLDPGTGPHSVLAGPDGYIWYTGQKSRHVGRIDAQTGDIKKYMMPREEAQDPHTHRFTEEGDMWITLEWSDFVAFMDLPSGDVELIKVPIEGSRPYGMDIDSDGRPWIALLGTNKLGTVDPETMEFSTVDIPWEGAHPRRLAVGSDDRVYFVDYGAGRVGIYDPSADEFQGWVTPSGENSAPYGMTIDHENRVYFVETNPQPNKFVGFDPETEEFFFVQDVPSGGQTIRNMRYDRATQSVWFGTDANTLGRAKIQPR